MLHPVGRVSEQDAGAFAIDAGPTQGCPEAVVIGRITVMDAHDLQSVDRDFLAVQHAHAELLHGVDVFLGIGKLFVISGDKICSPRNRQPGQGRGQFLHLGDGAVVHVAGDKYDVGLQPGKRGHNALQESGATNVPEVGIADQGGNPSTPGFRQVGQFDGNPSHPCPRRIHDAIQTCQHGQSKECGNQYSSVGMEPEQPGPAVDHPARACRQKTETKKSQPDGGNSVQDPHRYMRTAPGQQGSDNEADRQQGQRDLQFRDSGKVGRWPESSPGFVKKPMGQE